jgi:hypothetical protein
VGAHRRSLAVIPGGAARAPEDLSGSGSFFGAIQENVVSTKKLENMPQWAKVSEVFKTDEDAPFLERAGIEKVSDPRYRMYSQRLARLRGIRKYIYRMDVLERRLSYDEVTEIFVRVNSLGAKLRSSDLAHKEGSGGQWQQMGCQGLDPQGIAAAIESLL